MRIRTLGGNSGTGKCYDKVWEKKIYRNQTYGNKEQNINSMQSEGEVTWKHIAEELQKV